MRPRYNIGSHRTLSGALQLIVATVVISGGNTALAQRPQRVIEDLIRGTAKVADDVPLGKVDDLVAEVGKSRAVREAVDSEIRSAGRALDTLKDTRGLARADEVLASLRRVTSQLDPTVIRRLEQLDEGSREVALVLARGGDHVQRSLPDIAARGRFLREGGAETVAAIGTFGPDAARAAMRLDEAIQSGSLVVRGGSRAITVADFGRVMTRFGDASWSFWKTYVQPHWKVWLATGALAAYLADPESFQDAAGRLTESGFRRLTELAGEVAAAAIRGVGQGTGEAADQVANAFGDTFLTGAGSRSALIGTALVLVVVALTFRGVRSWVLRPLRKFQRSPKPKPSR